MLCLNAGKHVLCEKAFTVNAAQARVLVETAREKGVFLMEAMWTRFFPLCGYVRGLVGSGGIGDVLRMVADLSTWKDMEMWGDEHRAVNPELAGGALLDCAF
jgi:predicted dehydrogenase